jgi:hypothetical protein
MLCQGRGAVYVRLEQRSRSTRNASNARPPALAILLRQKRARLMSTDFASGIPRSLEKNATFWAFEIYPGRAALGD